MRRRVRPYIAWSISSFLVLQRQELVMAELHIEKKRRSGGLWIAIGLVLAALLAWTVLRPSPADDRSDTVPAATGSMPSTDASPVATRNPLFLQTS